VSIFEILRERVSLEELAGRFTELRASGEKLKGCCPHSDHADTSPSFYVYPDERFHCYGCGRHGDVVDLWAGIKCLDPGIGAALDLAREYGLEPPELDAKVREKMEEQRAKEDFYLKQAKVCHQALARHPSVVAWWEGRGFDEELRKRFLLGANRDGTAAVMPYWHRGRVHGLIRRKLGGEPKYLYPEAEHFPAGYRPLFIPGPLRGGAFLVEGIIDALALVALGENAIAVGGTNISEAQMRELARIPGPLYILPDADEQGDKAAREWVRHLYPKALVCPAEYGQEAEDA
jgi:DNA primase